MEKKFEYIFLRAGTFFHTLLSFSFQVHQKAHTSLWTQFSQNHSYVRTVSIFYFLLFYRLKILTTTVVDYESKMWRKMFLK